MSTSNSPVTFRLAGKISSSCRDIDARPGSISIFLSELATLKFLERTKVPAPVLYDYAAESSIIRSASATCCRRRWPVELVPGRWRIASRRISFCETLLISSSN